MINPMDLTGKHIVVTGASSGLGRQTCITLSQLGARVSLLARNAEKLKETLSLMEGTEHKVYPYDVTQTDGIEGWLNKLWMPTERSMDLSMQRGLVHPNR